ncbi:MAG TPA: hypothetical protein VME41_10370 [Stellaceae bacterium]|nr:hypothetical protein [Stellaceae bacterium]
MAIPSLRPRRCGRLVTNDGACLLFNLHVSGKGGRRFALPASDAAIVEDHARLLYRMSSPLPSRLAEAARAKGYSVAAGVRGFMFNADFRMLLDFCDIGTGRRMRARHLQPTG